MEFCRETCFGVLIFMTLLSAIASAAAAQESGGRRTKEVSRDELLDRNYGGWVGMLIGGIEGLAHEFKYNEQPRATLPDFEMLPNGARSDDDNDFELTHLYFMDQQGVLKLPYPRIVEIWKANMNAGIWFANEKARKLMDQGVMPPATGDVANNEFASYNLSAQFCMESYGMIAPGMPQTAADIGIHYAHIAVSGEPIHAAQFWTSLISLSAFHQGTTEQLLDEALKAIDPASAHAQVVRDAIQAYRDNPDDWKAARQTIYEKWLVQRKWNRNSTPSNGGMVVLALLYGKGDFYKSLQYAMALGLDADCNAAAVGALLGVRMGHKQIAALPGYKMPDLYLNKTRPQLPAEMKVSEQADLLMRVCEKVILEHGGEKVEIEGQPGYRIVLQDPKIIESLEKK